MSPEIIDQLNSNFQFHQICKFGAYVGTFGTAWSFLQPKSVLGYLGTVTIGIVGGAAGLIITDYAKSKFNDLLNDYYYKKTPVLMNRKAIPHSVAKQALNKLKAGIAFQNYLKSEGLNEKEVLENLSKRMQGGFCQGQSLEILLGLNVNYSLSCQDLLAKIKIVDALYNQLAYESDFTGMLSKHPKIIGGNLIFETFPACAPASFYQQIIEEAALHANSNTVVAGEIRLSTKTSISAHVITFQYSDGHYRFYDAEKGFYSYPTQTEFFEQLRVYLIGNYSTVCSHGFELRVQIIVYGIEKQKLN